MDLPGPGGDGGRKGFDTHGTDVGQRRSSGERCSVLRAGAKVAVIGGGSCGVYTCKTLREAGLNPVVFEQSHGIAGIWRDSGRDGVAYDALRTNSSDVITTAPGFPMQPTSSPFPHYSEILAYMEGYAKHFDLLRYIRFNTEVVSVRPKPVTSDPLCPHWLVTVRKLESDEGLIWSEEACSKPVSGGEETLEFEAVYICTGQYGGGGVWPELPGHECFTGPITHSQSYRRNESYADKNVLIVGIGNSALDLALDTSAVAKGVLVSARRSSSLIMAVDDPLGRPIDTFIHTRFNLYGPKGKRGSSTVDNPSGAAKKKADGTELSLAKDSLPVAGDNIAVMKAMVAAGLAPPAAASQSQLGMLKDRKSVLARINDGKIRFGPGIRELKENSVVLNDGREIPADAIICCTGYDLFKGLAYIDESVLEPLKKFSPSGRRWLDLYKMILPPQHRTLVFCGLINTDANEALVGEMQARWATAMLMGKVDWPSQDVVDDFCKQREERVMEADPAYTRFVRYVPYMDDLATDIGCLPVLPPLPEEWRDGAAHVPTPTTDEERYAFNLWFGPTVPSHWRLAGRDAWAEHEARKYVLEKLTPGIKTPAPREPVSWALPPAKL